MNFALIIVRRLRRLSKIRVMQKKSGFEKRAM